MKERKAKQEALITAKTGFYADGKERNRSWAEESQGKSKAKVAGYGGTAISKLKPIWKHGVLVQGRTFKEVRKVIMGIDTPSHEKYGALVRLANSLAANDVWDIVEDFVEDLIE